MVAFFIYQLKAAFCLAAFIGIYYIWLRKETFHQFNRIYLLASLMLAFLLPAFQYLFPFSGPGMIGPRIIETVTIHPDQSFVAQSSAVIQPLEVLFWIYVLISLFMAGFFISHLFNMIRLIKKYHIIRQDSYKVILLPAGHPSFSFFHYIFIGSNLTSPDYHEQVMQHECAHAQQRHSLDILFIQLIKMIHWFNPIIFLAEKALKETHEYLADGIVLEQDDRSDRYKLLLLTQVFGLRPGIFNFFNSSLIKKRLLMMTKEKSPRYKVLKYLTVIPVTALLIMLTSVFEVSSGPSNTAIIKSVPLQTQKESSDLSGSFQNEDPVFVEVEKDASFQGGNLEDFRRWVQKNLIYPEEAIKKGIHGKVFAQFEVNTKGTVENVKIVRSANPLLDEETMRVIQLSPTWEPATQEEEKVRQQFTIPVVFALSE